MDGWMFRGHKTAMQTQIKSKYKYDYMWTISILFILLFVVH